MNVLKNTKMNSKILVVVLLAYFLDNLSAATLKPVKPTSLNGKNTPAQSKNTLVFKQPIKSHPPGFGNFKINPTVPYNVPATQSPATPPTSPKLPTPTKPPTSSTHTFLPSIKKPLPPSRASAPTTVPKNENNNHQGFNQFGEGDDYYYEEEEEEVEEEEEKEGEEDDEEEEDEEEGEEDEEPLGNINTVKIPTQSKPTISPKVNNNSNKFQTSQLKPSSSTSKHTEPKRVNQGNDYHQGLKALEDDEPLENSNTVKIPTESKPTIFTKINNNSNKFQTSQSKPSSSPFKPTVTEKVNQENDNHQEFETLEGDDYEEVSDENEDGLNVEEYSEDLDHNTPTDNITINGDLVNLPVPINNPFSTVPQLSDNELTENNNKSEYSLNTDEDHPLFQNDDEWEPKSYNINNNDNTKDQLINTNEFESNPYDNTQIFTDKQEENAEHQINNQYGSVNKERIINRYEAIKKILYMLHDYASSIFNWIINKINYRMDHVSSQNII